MAPRAGGRYLPRVTGKTGVSSPVRARVQAALGRAGLFVVILELASYAAIALLNPRLDRPIQRTPALYRVLQQGIEARLGEQETQYELDTVLGWRYTVGYRLGFHHLNAQNLRSAREYDTVSSPGVLRVAAFGDSFVYGSELPEEDAWAGQIEARFPAIEVLNYGVRGYGDDQAYLRYRLEGHALHPQVVVLGFIPDDLNRLVSVYRQFWTTQVPAFTKPRLLVGPGDSLRVVPPPIRREADYRRYLGRPRDIRDLGTLDTWYEPAVYEDPLYDWSATVRLATAAWIRLKRGSLDPGRLVRRGIFNDRSEAYRLQLRVCEAFAREARAHGEVPVVLLLPDDRSVTRIRAGGVPVYAPLRADLARLAVPVLDVGDAFRDQPAAVKQEEWFQQGGHYSRAGSEVVARWLGPRLSAAYTPLSPPPSGRAVSRELR